MVGKGKKLPKNILFLAKLNNKRIAVDIYNKKQEHNKQKTLSKLLSILESQLNSYNNVNMEIFITYIIQLKLNYN